MSNWRPLNEGGVTVSFAAAGAEPGLSAQRGGHGGAWFSRQLSSYPRPAPRVWFLAVTVLSTVVLYYELYVQGSVATKVITHYGFTFTEFVVVLVVGNAVGAFGSLFAGLADRWGRANLVVGGLLISGLLVAFALPNASSRGWYLAFFAVLSVVEGIALVATPALIRDFSPQVGRGVAMAFWTMGPVLGSLLVTEISSHTLSSHPEWQYQFRVAGIVGLAIWVVALVGLRELSPQLRDQRMVTIRDRTLIEARAAGIDPDEMLQHQWRRMLRLDIVVPALGISLFLLLYYVFVAFLVVFFVTTFGYSEARANDLGNWYWIANAIALLCAGLLSDGTRVRKPFMVFGALVSIVGVGWFAATTTQPATGYGTFALYFVIMAAGAGIAYVTWMAAFTETIERHNPAATATGLAIWGWIIRIVVTVSFAILPTVVPATTTLVDHGPQVKRIVATYPTQVHVLTSVSKTTLAHLQVNPTSTSARLSAVAQLAAVPPATVAAASAIAARYPTQLATAAALSPATQHALASEPTNPHALAAAVEEVARTLHVTPAQAHARLVALAAVPRSDLLLAASVGPRINTAAAQLATLSTIPPADVAYLQAHASDVTAAARENPGQWQTWWWICFGGQIVFLPCVFLLAGRWSPRKARDDEHEHDRQVQQELAVLRPSGATSGSA